MNEAMSISNIAAYAEAHNLYLIENSNVLYGQIDTKLWKYALFAGFATLDIRHLLLVFHSDHLSIIGLTLSTNFSGSIINIPTSEINPFNFKKTLMQSGKKLI